MATLRPHLEAPVLIGVGAAFDFHAGLVPQAPPWLQRAGLEWAYRLAHEPRRLWRRYLRYNPRFVGAFARQLAEHRSKRRDVLKPPPVRLPGRDLKELLGDAVPQDHARQTLADRYIERELGRRDGQPWRVLDLGCGTGSSVDVFRARDPEVELGGHRRSGLAGGAIPDANRRPVRDLRRGIDAVRRRRLRARVLQAGARARSPSRAAPRRGPPGARPRRVVRRLDLPARDVSLAEHVELHAGGIVALLEQAGLRAVELRPGIDGFTLIAWRVAGGHRCFHRWWGRESPFNRALNGCARVLRPTSARSTPRSCCSADSSHSWPSATRARRDRL